MGAKSRQAHGMVELQAKALRGSDIYLDFPSVGATENILLAATRAKGGLQRLKNAAAEPEICDLADFLRKMGAEIEGDGTDTITIRRKGAARRSASGHSRPYGGRDIFSGGGNYGR